MEREEYEEKNEKDRKEDMLDYVHHFEMEIIV